MAAPTGSIVGSSASTQVQIAKRSFSEARGAFQKKINQPFEIYIDEYINLMSDYSEKELQKYKESIQKGFKEALLKVKELKKEVNAYLEKNPQKASKVCFHILEMANDSKGYPLAPPILELMRENKIILSNDAEHIPVLKLLHLFCEHRTSTTVIPYSSSELINLAYSALSGGYKTNDRKIFELSKNEHLSEYFTGLSVSHYLYGALSSNNVELVLESFRIIRQFKLPVQWFEKACTEAAYRTFLDQLKDLKSPYTEEILQFLVGWHDTKHLDGFSKHLSELTKQDPTLALHWLKTLAHSPEQTATRSIMFLIKQEKLANNPNFRLELVYILILAQAKSQVSFYEEVINGIHHLNSDSINYIDLCAEDFLEGLKKNSNNNQFDDATLSPLFCLMCFHEFHRKCFLFIQEHRLEKRIPLQCDLSLLKDTPLEPIVYVARSEKGEKPKIPAVLEYMFNPSLSKTAMSTHDFVNTYTCGVSLGVVNYFSICLEKIHRVKLSADDLVVLFYNTPRKHQKALLEEYIRAFFLLPKIENLNFQLCLKELQIALTVEMRKLEKKTVDPSMISKFSGEPFLIDHFDLSGVNIVQTDSSGRTQYVECYHLSVQNPGEIAISRKTERLTLSGNIAPAFTSLPNLKLYSLEFNNFFCESVHFGTLNTYSTLRENLREVIFASPIGGSPFGDEAALKFIPNFPEITSYTFCNTDISEDTILKINLITKVLKEFKLTTTKNWSILKDEIKFLLIKFKESLRSFTFRNSNTKIPTEILDYLRPLYLERLCLSGKVDDFLVDRITLSLSQLNTLELPFNPDITDKSEPAIVSLRSLENLNVAGTSMTSATILKMVKKLPFLRCITIGLQSSADNELLANILSENYEVFIETSDPSLPLTFPVSYEPIKV